MTLGQKVVFLDIDGTILNSDKKIPIATKRAVNELQEAGVIVSIATGRAPFMFQDILEELNLKSYIGFNGQYAVHNDDVIYQNPIETEQLEELTTFSVKNNHPLVYQAVHDMRSNVSEHSHIEAGMNSLKRSHPLMDTEYYTKEKIYQALVFMEQDEQAMYEEAFKQLRFVRWHPFSCDVMPANGSKANGIANFIKALNIDWEDTYAFGDGLNDLEMIKKVHTGVALGNGVQEVKDAATLVTDHVDEDGLSKAMKKLGLIR
ncbi:Cof-type HAD-IIB family hydrolase [Gracilibacillus sp. S3-1-1]|uniref:Cof-type HAD-IIB family hydrolase n=1 Tax=Gracilibacillus pellucidus TaxID=3095368 RepID=A0ACC6M1Q5_9BACI|nr:Cof-type HAD-IIB family hydrolase [Gracilibacillus sp. S3-1-1]MDX8044875.1 Cof-type HAD-IIB family hydrolase [Gracilibacillus sp. S3-1-1]